MPADTYGSILGLIQQATGNNNNNWGAIFNTSFASPDERAIAGIATRTDTGGTVDLSTVTPPAGLRLDIDFIQKFTGALVSDLTVIVPNVSKTWWFQNSTTNAFFMYVKTPAGTAIQIPQGVGLLVMGDGANNLTRSDKINIGDFKISGKQTPGSGELACNGASLLRSAYPDLFAAIGVAWGAVDGVHFTLPNLTDTGRFLRSSGGGNSVGAYQANQNLSHTHTVTGAPGVGTLGTDAQGAHTPTGSISNGAITSMTVNVSSGSGGGPLNITTGGFSGSATFNFGNSGISFTQAGSTFTGNVVGAHTHNVTGAPSVGSLGTASSGGTEARPETAVALICIRY